MPLAVFCPLVVTVGSIIGFLRYKVEPTLSLDDIIIDLRSDSNHHKKALRLEILYGFVQEAEKARNLEYLNCRIVDDVRLFL